MTDTTNTLNRDDMLQLLQVSQEDLTDILSACNWGELTQFTEEQSNLLLTVNKGHTEHGWDFLESYLRGVAHRKGLPPEQFDLVALSIAEAGKTLFDYREQFEDICNKVLNGTSPQEAVAPPVNTVTDAQLKDAVHKSIPSMDSDSILEMIKEMGKTNARRVCNTFEGFAQQTADDQAFMEQTYIEAFREEINLILNSAEFQQRIEVLCSGGVTEEERKKRLTGLLFGVQTPAKLLSGTA